MMIYKFRPLITGTDFCRLKHIIETGEFWCSNFYDLNDPMEGVFSIFNTKEVARKINKIYGEKGRYKICSFSGGDKYKKGFHSPIMWGHYAGGFKGVAIGVEVEVSPVKYNCSSPQFSQDNDIEEEVERMLLAKHSAWGYENEYRFLKKRKNNFNKIGEIKEIYFGNSYGNVSNSGEIRKNKIFQKHLAFKEEIINLAKIKGISYRDVKVESGEVVKEVN